MSIYQWMKKNVGADEALAFDWMIEHVERFMDEGTGELDEEALVRAWDVEGRKNGATIAEARDAAHKLSTLLDKPLRTSRLPTLRTAGDQQPNQKHRGRRDRASGARRSQGRRQRLLRVVQGNR